MKLCDEYYLEMVEADRWADEFAGIEAGMEAEQPIRRDQAACQMPYLPRR
jgi:hypothetical protein